LHAFQKKAKSGIAMPKPDKELIKERLKVAEQIAKERGKMSKRKWHDVDVEGVPAMCMRILGTPTLTRC